MSSGSVYPTTLDSSADKVSGDQLTVADVNTIRSGIEKIEAELATLPKGGFTSVKNRLDNAAYLIGLAGGQTLNGGTAASENLTLSSTIHATKGKILFGAAGAFDEVNQRLGIGTTTPAVDFQIEKNTSLIARLAGAGPSSVAQMILRRARNTLASPQLVQSGDTLGLFNTEAHDGSAYQTATQILAVAAENWSGSVRGSGIEFYSNIIGTTSLVRIGILKAGFGLELDAQSGFVNQNEMSVNPSPADGTQAIHYMKGDKFIIAYNHGGTVKYRYLDLTSTNATWTYTTSAP